MGCGAGEKHLLFSAELCYGLDPAYQGKLLSITDLNCLPGVSYTLVFVQMPAGFNQFRRLEVRRSPFFGRTLIPIRIVACHLRDLPVEWLVSLWQTWLVVSFEGSMQSWPHKRQIALGSLGNEACPKESKDRESSWNQVMWSKELELFNPEEKTFRGQEAYLEKRKVGCSPWGQLGFIRWDFWG